MAVEIAAAPISCQDSLSIDAVCSIPTAALSALPADVLQRILLLADFPTRLAAVCVCKEWKDAVSESHFWHQIHVPKALACRLWDDEFAPLIKKARGELTALQVSGSGITGRSLLTLSDELRASSQVIEELRFEHCYNLSGTDIVHFVEAITSRSGGPRIQYVAIEGLCQVSPADVARLASRVDRLDVGVCICTRVEPLVKCQVSSCQGLCQHCAEMYKYCEMECGSCNQPQNSHQLLRVRAHRWSLQINPEIRTRWRDVRHGMT